MGGCMMMKIISVTFLFVFMMIFVGCKGEEKGQLTRIDVQKMNPEGKNYGDVVRITDHASIELLRTTFKKVEWEPGTVPSMARQADVKATLFFEFDTNMPARLHEYEIWLNENAGTATIISNSEKEGYGRLDKDSAGIIKNELLYKPTDWEVRNEYAANDKVLFRIYPDPALATGKPYGYMISFTEPFETYKGKELAIYAYHKETGQSVIALPPKKITEPSSGYSSLNRFTTTFQLPVGGIWRFEVVLNEKMYGDVILSVKESSS
jgi:hypothetical protein